MTSQVTKHTGKGEQTQSENSTTAINDTMDKPESYYKIILYKDVSKDICKYI